MNSAAPFVLNRRLYFLDWLRILAFGLLILYHVGMVYVSWDFHFKSPSATTALEPWMRLSSPWRMSLLFLLSGAVTALLLARPAGAFLRSRSKRLLVPLVFGMLVIVPPQAYVEVVHKMAYPGSYLQFMGLYLSGYGGFCADEGRCIILPTWNHLWFLAYLWVYTVLLWAVLARWPSFLDALGARLVRGLRFRMAWLLAPVVGLWLLRLALASKFPSTHALIDDWFNHAQYLGFFLAGAVFVKQPGIWALMADLRWHAIVLAIASWALGVALSPPVSPLAWLLRSGVQWWAIVAALGFAYRHLDVDHPWRASLNEAVYPVYILHQTVLVLAAAGLAPMRIPPPIEGSLLVAITLGGSVLGYLFARRIGWLRLWMGLPPLGQRAALQ